jgi:hypothetical protein
VCRRCNAEVPERFYLASALRIYLYQTSKIRNNLNANDTVQYPPLRCVCWRYNVQEENAERYPPEYGGDDHEQLDTSYDKFEHQLLPSFRQGVKVSS